MIEKKPLCLIVGPTAIGKTEVSIKLAKKLNGEIISADSMQIYKYMNIGTAKIAENEKEEIPHYMIDIINPDENFTVAEYKKMALKYINNIHRKNKLPIIVGGSGLYINSIVYNLNFTKVSPNEELRKEYNKLAETYGNQYIYNKLKAIDPKSAKRINQNDTKRIIRAIEIYHSTGKPMSCYYDNFRKENDNFNIIMIGLVMNRHELYEKINNRVDMMIQNGLIQEVEHLLKMGYNENLKSMEALGYKEIIMYLKGQLTLNDATNQIKKKTRNFAKRQLTWFRRDNRIKWINLDEFNNKNEAIEYIIKYVKHQF